MSISASKGYTFGSTELVTADKLHSLVDSATLTISYKTTFQLGSIVTSNLTIAHNLGQQHCNVQVWNYAHESLDMSNIKQTALNTTTLVLDMGSYPSLASVCNVRVFG